jgi:hypothetical protein
VRKIELEEELRHEGQNQKWGADLSTAHQIDGLLGRGRGLSLPWLVQQALGILLKSMA